MPLYEIHFSTTDGKYHKVKVEAESIREAKDKIWSMDKYRVSIFYDFKFKLLYQQLKRIYKKRKGVLKHEKKQSETIAKSK